MIDPLNPGNHYYAGIIHYYAGQREESRRAFAEVLRLVPAREIVHHFLAKVAVIEGKSQEAVQEAEREKHPAFRPLALALAYQAAGRRQEAEAQILHVEKEFGDIAAFWLAEVHVFRGEKDKALGLLEKAYGLRQPAMTGVKGDPLLRPLEGDPRFQALLRRMKL